MQLYEERGNEKRELVYGRCCVYGWSTEIKQQKEVMKGNRVLC